MSGIQKKIMVVDDERSVCEVLKRLLDKEGYAVKTESEPEKAIEGFSIFLPDCVLLDLKMPAVDGLDLLVKMKEISPSCQVVVVTGHGGLESAMEAMKLGAYDYITKPFDLEYIRLIVKKALGID